MKPVTFLVVLLGLAACDAQVETRKTALPAEQAAPAPAAAAPPLTPAGPGVTISSAAGAELQQAASVVQLDPLLERNGKLFGTAGGDPAMNGLQTWIAFFHSPAEGWTVFPLGDFLAYRVLSSTEGRVDLEITESRMDPATGQIGSATRKIIVTYGPGPDGSPPRGVMVTPAR